MTFLNDVKELIDKHEVISFDIFDTLLLRPYVKPTDLFLHLERLENAVGFAKARIEAEQKARKVHANLEDITIDEIYDEIADKYKNLKSKELDLECQILQPNPEMKEVFDYAKKSKKRIIIVSDMYLPAKFLSDVLHKKGFNGFEKVYVSCEYRKMKHSGGLFSVVLENLSILPNYVLHFGDNEHSDVRVPKSLSIHSVWVQKPLDKFFRQDIRVSEFYKENEQNLNISIMLGVVSYIYALSLAEYWTIFGFKYAGPVIYAYMNWLLQELEKDKIKDVLFIARDGYTLKKVFDILKKNNTIKSSYVYASRIFDILFNLSYETKLKVDEKEGISCVRKIINYYKDKDTTLKKDAPNIIENCQQGAYFIEKHRSRFERLAKKKKNDYIKYINQYLRHDNVAMIDTCSIHMSSQRLLKDFCSSLGTKITGYYWFVKYASDIDYKNFDFKTFQLSHEWEFVDWDIMEFLITSPEPPIEDITTDGLPIYKELSEYEKTRSLVYPFVSKGAVLFTKIIKQFFSDIQVTMTAEDVTKWINNFCKIPSDYDLPYISTIYHGYDASHEQYTHICKPWFIGAQEPLKEIKCRVFGLPLVKYKKTQYRVSLYLFDLMPLFTYKKKVDRTELKILGIPIYTKKFAPHKIKIKLFKIFPLLTIRSK